MSDGGTDVAIPRDCITCDGPGCSQRAPTKKCSRCRVTYYCSKQCQVNHFKMHKATCKAAGSRWEKIDRTFPVDEDPPVEECGICFEMHPGTQVIVPCCGHGFCYQCLRQWSKTIEFFVSPAEGDGAPLCPMCRTPLTVTLQAQIDVDISERALYLAKCAAMAKTSEEKEALSRKACAKIDKLLPVNPMETLQKVEMDSNTELVTEPDILKELPSSIIDIDALLKKSVVLNTVGKPKCVLSVLSMVNEMLRTMSRISNRFHSALSQQCSSTLHVSVTTLWLVPLKRHLRRLEVKYHVTVAETLVALKDHSNAYSHVELSREKLDLGDLSYNLKCRYFSVVLACHYGLGRLNEVLECCPEICNKLSCAITPHAYKYMALAQRDQGDIAAARDTVNKGLLYSIMDEIERAELMDLYKELVEQK